MRHDPAQRPRRSDASAWIIACCLLVILGLSGLIVYLLRTRPAPGQAAVAARTKAPPPPAAPPRVLPLPPEVPAPPSRAAARPGEDVRVLEPEPVPLLEIPGPAPRDADAGPPQEGQGDASPAALQDQEDNGPPGPALLLEQAFSRLDGQDFMAGHRPARDYFADLCNKLLANPPAAARETDDLFTVLRNTAHFFRIIGRENIELIKTILHQERDQVEDLAAALYGWVVLGQDADRLPALRHRENTYQYACFFLGTMGGRSYLFRRDSRSRLLVNYYSILVIDRAQQEGTNVLGFNPGPHIRLLARDLRDTTSLRYRTVYLRNLEELAARYPGME